MQIRRKFSIKFESIFDAEISRINDTLEQWEAPLIIDGRKFKEYFPEVKWECSKHYISVGPLYSKTKNEYYICNNWCPKCHSEERKEFKKLLEELSDVGHFTIDKIKKEHITREGETNGKRRI